MKKILVTGGAGFIGSHLCQKLLDKECIVFCLDNFQTGNPKNIKALESSDNFYLIEKDVTQSFSVEVDEIYHLACPASPKQYQQSSVQTARTAILGTLNAIELAKELSAKLLLASTSEVYGDPQVHPQSENYWGNVNALGKRGCYNEGKRAAEMLCYNYAHEFNLDIKIARIFNTYGPNMQFDDGRVISNFIVQALKGEDLTVYGTGEQTRSFCYVNDLIDGLIELMNKGDKAPINLGNPSEISMVDLARKIIELTGSRSRLTHKELPEDDPIKRKPDILNAQKVLKWSPKISLENGLNKTIEYFKNEMESL